MDDDWARHPNAPQTGTVVCSVAALADGTARVFAFGTGWPILELIVVRGGDTIHAYINRCAHRALPLNIGSRVRTAGDLMFCDHHHAGYRFSDGVCVEGVCIGAALAAIPVRVTEGNVIVA